MSEMSTQSQLEARLRFVGRFTPGVEPTGATFRAECDFGLVGMLNMVYVELELPPAPSGAVQASIWLLSPALVLGTLRTGAPFSVYAGTELIAQGEVVAVAAEGLQNGA
jgi:hypothetical protein